MHHRVDGFRIHSTFSPDGRVILFGTSDSQIVSYNFKSTAKIGNIHLNLRKSGHASTRESKSTMSLQNTSEPDLSGGEVARAVISDLAVIRRGRIDQSWMSGISSAWQSYLLAQIQSDEHSIESTDSYGDSSKGHYLGESCVVCGFWGGVISIIKSTPCRDILGLQ